MAMVIHLQNFAIDHIPQPFQVDNKARHRIDISLHRHFKSVVMAVSIFVRTLAEGASILLVGKRIVPVIMCCGKFGFTCQQNHSLRLKDPGASPFEY